MVQKCFRCLLKESVFDICNYGNSLYSTANKDNYHSNCFPSLAEFVICQGLQKMTY